MQSDIVQRLEALYVWSQSVADHHADILTPRQIEKLYAVGQAGTEAAAEITRLNEAVRAAEEREAVLREALHQVKAEGDRNHNTRCRDWWPAVCQALAGAKP